MFHDNTMMFAFLSQIFINFLILRTLIWLTFKRHLKFKLELLNTNMNPEMDLLNAEQSIKKKTYQLAKLIFWDFGLTCSDLCADLIQVYVLLLGSDHQSRVYGFISLSIIYYPAPFYIASLNRTTENGFKAGFITQGVGKVVLYPLLLPIAHARCAWKLYKSEEW